MLSDGYQLACDLDDKVAGQPLLNKNKETIKQNQKPNHKVNKALIKFYLHRYLIQKTRWILSLIWYGSMIELLSTNLVQTTVFERK